MYRSWDEGTEEPEFCGVSLSENMILPSYYYRWLKKGVPEVYLYRKGAKEPEGFVYGS